MVRYLETLLSDSLGKMPGSTEVKLEAGRRLVRDYLLETHMQGVRGGGADNKSLLAHGMRLSKACRTPSLFTSDSEHGPLAFSPAAIVNSPDAAHTRTLAAELLNACDALLERNHGVFHDIRGLHTQLRQGVAAAAATGTGKGRAPAPSPTALHAYAEAATSMGDKPWVATTHHWLASFATKFFRRNGARKAYIARTKKQYREVHGRSCHTLKRRSWKKDCGGICSAPKQEITQEPVRACSYLTSAVVTILSTKSRNLQIST